MRKKIVVRVNWYGHPGHGEKKYKWRKKEKIYIKNGSEINRDARKLHGYPGSKKHNKRNPIKREKKADVDTLVLKKSAREKHLFK